jgi:hypothetical protein
VTLHNVPLARAAIRMHEINAGLFGDISRIRHLGCPIAEKQATNAATKARRGIVKQEEGGFMAGPCVGAMRASFGTRSSEGPVRRLSQWRYCAGEIGVEKRKEFTQTSE